MYKVNQEQYKRIFGYFKPITKNFIIGSQNISQSFCHFSVDNFNINNFDDLPLKLKKRYSILSSKKKNRVLSW
ncbi:hypothetical protein [Gilliamella apicola]|uniref:hypothetical protein n=1 Tax=Gilliamella apicola TaxID=1196095 RepID=UPI002FEE4CF5